MNFKTNKENELKNKKNFDNMKVDKYFKNQNVNLIEGESFQDSSFPPSKESILLWSENVEIFNEIEFKRAGEIFGGNFEIFEEKIEINDIKIKNQENKNFLLALAEISKYPELIINLFRTKFRNDNGYYELILFIEGEWQIVILDDFFPVKKGTNQLYFTSTNNNEIWVILLEKAWSKVKGSYSNSFSTSIFEALQAITGFTVESYSHKELKNSIWENLKVNKSVDITLAKTNSSNSVENLGLRQNYYFSIIESKEVEYMKEKIRLVKLKDLFRLNNWKGNYSNSSLVWNDRLKKLFEFDKDKFESEGIFYIELDDYINYFSSTITCFIQNNSFYKSYDINNEGQRVFHFEIPRRTRVAISLLKTNNLMNSCLILSRYTKISNSITFLEGRTGENDINIIQELDEGSYIVNVQNFVDSKVKFIISVKDTIFRVLDIGIDKKFEILNHFIVSDIKPTNESKGELFFQTKTNFKKMWIGYAAFSNFSKDHALKLDIDLTGLKNFKLLNYIPGNDGRIQLTINPQSDIIILGYNINPKERSQFYVEYSHENSQTQLDEVKEIQISKDNYNYSNLKEDFDYYIEDFSIIHEHNIFKKIEKTDQIFKSLSEKYQMQIKMILEVTNIKDSVLGKNVFWSEREDYDNGFYIGQKNLQNERHNIGMYVWNNDDYYVGQWFNGKRTGLGKTFSSENKITYEGEYMDGMRNGKGSLFYSNGDSYKGMFVEDRLEGLGCYTWNEGISWTGEFLNDTFHGVGLFRYSDGRSKIREFVNGDLI